MPAILDGNGALLIAPTASGKTEAAVLPIVSEISRLRLDPVALLYISPLRALINDQTRRAQVLLEENGLRVAWWHGDLEPAARKKILREPPHALFTTPESVEVMLSSDSYGHGALLGNARYILIDEIHAFGENDRGAQLMSLLRRLECEKRTPLVRIGLSATVSKPETILSWMQSSRADAPAIVPIVDQTTRPRKIGVGCMALPPAKPGSADEDHNEAKIATIVRRHVEGRRAIVFMNSRGDAERLTFLLREADVDAMVHHGSIDKSEREVVEARFRVEGPKCIVATSTLELGIDIGDLELVVQIGPTATASSLLQRLGRSGRRDDAISTCVIYAEHTGDLPVVLAVAELALEGVVEPVVPQTAALQVLFHQVLQLLRERARATRDEILDVLMPAGSFRDIPLTEAHTMLDEMLEMQFLERERDWLILGSEAERAFGAMNYRDSYAVFEVETEWTVRTTERVIGSLARSFPIAKDRDTFVILGGRSWRIIAVDENRLVLLVEPAARVNVPRWTGMGPGSSYEVMQRTVALLTEKTGALETPLLAKQLADARADAKRRMLAPNHMVIEVDEDGTLITTYFGSELNNYLATLLIGHTSRHVFRPNSESIRAKDCPAGEAQRALRELIDDPAARATALERALPRLSQAQIGRFWPYFGPQTQINVLRHFFRRGEALFSTVEGCTLFWQRESEKFLNRPGLL